MEDFTGPAPPIAASLLEGCVGDKQAAYDNCVRLCSTMVLRTDYEGAKKFAEAARWMLQHRWHKPEKIKTSISPEGESGVGSPKGVSS